MNRIILLFPLLTSSTFGWELSTPSHASLWKSAQIVVVSDRYEINKTEDQSNLPEYKDLEYTRIEVTFTITDVLKGEMDETSETIEITTYHREQTGDTGDWGMFVVPPKGFQELPHGTVFYLFMRWDAYGNLVPIDEEYYSLRVFRE